MRSAPPVSCRSGQHQGTQNNRRAQTLPGAQRLPGEQPAVHALTPKDLSASSMVTSAAIAQRLNRLEAQGYVQRSPSCADRRGKLVSLTDAGRAAVDAALPDHVATEPRLLATLDEDERAALAALLAKLDD